MHKNHFCINHCHNNLRIISFYVCLIPFIIFSVYGCGSMKRAAVGSAAGILNEASVEIETESNWEHFRKSAPANLKMIEGMLFVDKENKELLANLVKGYAAYGFVVYETLYFEDTLDGKDGGDNLRQLKSYYTKAIEYAERYLKLNGLAYADLMKNVDNISNLLNEKMESTKADYETILFMAQAVGGLINSNRNNMSLVAQMPVVKGLFDWVCGRDDGIAFGACPIFYGMYESARPASLGGNPEKAKIIFKEAFQKYPANWLIRSSYLQSYVVTTLDNDEYKAQKLIMDRYALLFDDFLSWGPGEDKNNFADGMFENKRLRLYQALALKRYEIIKSHEKDLF